MKALVVYESMYGNTHDIAEAVGEGLGSIGDVTVASVADVEPSTVTDVDVLVVGGPTHMHGMSSSTSRRVAAEAADDDEDLRLEPGAEGPGLRDWLHDLPKSDRSSMVAAFDTRIEKAAILTGSAAKGYLKLLRRRHYRAMSEGESFFVLDTDGPLKDGEIERAREWAAGLVAITV